MSKSMVRALEPPKIEPECVRTRSHPSILADYRLCFQVLIIVWKGRSIVFRTEVLLGVVERDLESACPLWYIIEGHFQVE
jgi:hypothetical protein